MNPFPTYENATPQFAFIPCSIWNTTIEHHNGTTPVIEKKSRYTSRGCHQSHKEYPAEELRFVLIAHIARGLEANKYLEST
jgi:hypothetical protein